MITTGSSSGRVVFRSATASDVPAVAALLVSSGLPTAGIAELFSHDASQFIVAVSSTNPSEVLAVAGLEVCCNNALLRSVAVREDWQRKGLGQELVRRAVREAETRGIRALYLLTLTSEHYFPRFGFSTVGRDSVPAEIAETLEFKSACPASAIAMERVLVSR